MNERTNGQRETNRAGDPPFQGLPGGVHASDEQLNALIEAQLDDAEREAVELHVAGCDTCQTHLAELRGMLAMLRALPEPAPNRSFHLGPEHVKSGASPWSRLAALLLPALPALRTATVAVALLLAAVSIRNVVQDPADRGPVSESGTSALNTEPPVTAPTQSAGQNTAELPSNQQPTQPTIAAQSAFAETEEPASERTESDIAPTAAGAAGGAVNRDTTADQASAADSAPAADPADAFESSNESEDSMTFADASEETGPADGAGDSAAKTQAGDADDSASANQVGESGADGEIAGDAAMTGLADEETNADEDISMAAIAPPPSSPTVEPSPTATATATATALPTATQEPSPTVEPSPTITPAPVDSVAASAGETRDGWEIAQLALAIALIVLIALSIAATRLRSGRRPAR